jgi:hypothetical protein
MSKAEEAARSLGYGTDPLNREEYTANEVWEAFIDGYHQAEKDNELTWKDIEKICLIAKEVHQFRGFWSESVYQEVLKRFKDLKKGKRNENVHN